MCVNYNRASLKFMFTQLLIHKEKAYSNFTRATIDLIRE